MTLTLIWTVLLTLWIHTSVDLLFFADVGSYKFTSRLLKAKTEETRGDALSQDAWVGT